VSVQHIVVVGNDGAACAAATALAISLQGSLVEVSLLRPAPDAAINPIEVCTGGPESFHQVLGLDEQVLRKDATTAISLGTRYSVSATDFFLPLGHHGKTLRLVDFHHYVAKRRAEGHADELNAYSLPAAQAASGQFQLQGDPTEDAAKTFAYELNVDRECYAAFLLSRAAELGVAVVEASVTAVELDDEAAIAALALSNGTRLEADLYVDCSADRCVAGCLDGADDFDDWSRWFHIRGEESSGVEQGASPDLFACVEATDTGWLHGISTGNNSVSTVMTVGEIPKDSGDVGPVVGKYTRPWVKNCIAVGRAAATAVPLEVSVLQLAHNSILRLLAMLPREPANTAVSAEFNRIFNAELDGVRDYQLLPFALMRGQADTAGRSGLPDSLQERIELFSSHGRFTPKDNEFFGKARWVSAFINSGAWPESYDPLADMIDEERMHRDLRQFRAAVNRLA